jgi:uncharacterized membrane protein YeaQ/YmgE (transglycosylase-associated protein family)
MARFSLRICTRQGVLYPEQSPGITRLDAGRPAECMAGHEQEGTHMGFIVWLIVGGLIGWIASMIMRTDAQQGVILNVIVGIIGAVIAGLILGGGNINNSNPLDLTNILYSLLGAIVLLAVVNLVRRGSVR